MQEIIVLTPYRFVPPHRGWWWPWAIQRVVANPFLRRGYGVRSHECRGAEHLRASIRAGHGVLLVGNHSRPCDPMAAGWLTDAVEHPFFCMASWHTFMGTRLDRFMIRRCGAFSVYREGADHTSVKFAIDAIATAERPVLLFAEGSVSRSNDRLRPLLDGTSVVARRAARRRAKFDSPGKVVMHPVIFKYFFRGDLDAALSPVLERLEHRLGWQPGSPLRLLDRVRRIGGALLTLRELEYFDRPQAGEIHERIDRLLARLLEPLEEEYGLGDATPGGVYERVQRLRSRIVPDLIAGNLDAGKLNTGNLDAAQQARRRRQLADCYVAQTLNCYPKDYLGDDPPAERVLETVERLEEDLTDKATIHGPLDLVIQVSEAIDVEPQRARDAAGDPLMRDVAARMREMLCDVAASPPPIPRN